MGYRSPIPSFRSACAFSPLYALAMARSEPPSGTSTPRSFINQTASTEDLLKSQTVGLVHLDDFRKRRAEVLEQKEKEAQDKTYGRFKSSTPRVGTPGAHDESDG